MTDDTPLLGDTERAVLEATAMPVPAGFADCVVAARRAERASAPRRRAARLLIAGAVLAGAATIIFAVLPSRSSRSATGELAAAARTTATVGDRAMIVLEAGAAVSWRVTDNGDARVAQPRGAVFYRVERGGAFVVETPGGEVAVEGTCFAVAVTRDAATQVTVYEGRVVLSSPRGSTRLAAGERAVARAGAQPGPATAVEPLAAPDPSRELAALRARIRELEAETATRDEPPRSEADRLAADAAECRISWDLPITGVRGRRFSPMEATALAISEPERARLEDALRALEARVLEELRHLYTEVTGAAPGPLSWDALQDEIHYKSRERDVQEAFRRISAERAGVATPPADFSRLSAVERMYRLLTSLGDEAEREVAAVLGPARAHSLRTLDGGWGSRHSASRGCPE